MTQLPSLAPYPPDAGGVIAHDVECIKILTELGMLDKMEPKPPHNTTYHTFEAEHHWCMASCSRGFVGEGNNGYLIVVLPKVNYTCDEAARWFAEAVREANPEAPLEFTMVQCVNPMSN